MAASAPVTCVVEVERWRAGDEGVEVGAELLRPVKHAGEPRGNRRGGCYARKMQRGAKWQKLGVGTAGGGGGGRGCGRGLR